MAITHELNARNAATDAVVNLIDADANPGYVRIRVTTTTLVDITLAAIAFGDSTNGTAAMASLPRTGTATGAGIADNFQIFDGANVLIMSGTVSASGGGGDMIIDNTNIAIDQTVNIVATTSYTALTQ